MSKNYDKDVWLFKSVDRDCERWLVTSGSSMLSELFNSIEEAEQFISQHQYHLMNHKEESCDVTIL
jgi:hypothetical protein